MRLERIDLPAFGCIADFSQELSPGLNVFFGENEAGKSTLQGAICALLYGFFDGDRARPDESERHNRFRPWTGSAYRGSLQYEISDGRRFEVRRDFSTTDILTQVIDLVTGVDVSPQFGRGRHGNVPFARKHFGMSRGVFQSCAFISQGEVFQVTKNASPGQIGDAIAALADSARRDVSAARAIERLDALMSRIGSDRARTADLPKAREGLRLAKEELRAADATRAAMAEKAALLDAVEAKRTRLADEATRAEFLLHRSRAGALRRLLGQLDEAAPAIAAGQAEREALATLPEMDPGLRDRLLSLRTRAEVARAAVQRTRQERDEAAARLTDTDRLEYEALRTSVSDLTAEQVAALERCAYREAPRTALWAAIAAAIVAIARAIASLVLRLLRRQPSVGAQHAAPLRTPELHISPEDAQSLLDKHRRFLALRPLIEGLQALDRRLRAEEEGLRDTGESIAAQLQPLGVAAADGMSAFEALWEQRERCLATVAAADEASRRRAALLAGRSRDEIEGALADHEGAAADMLASHPSLAACEDALPAEGLARKLDGLREERHAADLEANRLSEELRHALGSHRPRAEIEEDLARWEAEAARLLQARDAAALAKEAIQQAMVNVYRDFAPAVNTFLSEGVEHVTGGRYVRAHVDPASLQVSLLVPETGLVVTDPPVSHGTRTLVYVLMRIGLAQHMSSLGEPVPLVLDDPFVDVDATRLPRILDFLLTLSERMQVLYFTKDEAVLRWFQDSAASPEHRLHLLDRHAFAAAAL